MPTLSQHSSHPALYQQDLLQLIYEIAYGRALIASTGGKVREHDEPLRLALRDALSRLDATDEERLQVAYAALEAAWGRLARQLDVMPDDATNGPIANAA